MKLSVSIKNTIFVSSAKGEQDDGLGYQCPLSYGDIVAMVMFDALKPGENKVGMYLLNSDS